MGLGSTGLVALLTSLSLCLSFASQWLILSTLGPGRETDLFYAAAALPLLVLNVLAGPLGNVLLPLFAADDARRGERTATAVLLVAAAAVPGAATLAVSAGWWIRPLFPALALDADTLAHLARLQCLSIAPSLLAAVVAASAQARGRFVRVAAMQAAAAGASLAFVAVGVHRLGVEAAAWALLLRAVLELVLLLPCSGWQPGARIDAHFARDFWSRLKPMLGVAAFTKTDILVERCLASLAPPGALSLYTFGQQLVSAAMQVLVRSVGVPLAPRLAQSHARGDSGKFTQLARAGAARAGGAALAIWLGIVVAGGWAVAAGIGGAGWTPNHCRELWLVLVLLGGVLVGGVAGWVLAQALQARGSIAILARVGVWGFTLSLPVKAIAFSYFGIVGLAWAGSLYYLVNTMTLWRYLRPGHDRAMTT